MAQTLRKTMGIILCILVVAVNYSAPVQAMRELPAELNLRAGQVHAIEIGWPFALSTPDTDMQVLASTDDSVDVVGRQVGEGELTVSAFGVPIKTVAVSVEPARVLVPGGHSIGAALNMQGVLIVGSSELEGSEQSPAKAAGLREGDMILEVEGEEVLGAAHLTELIGKYGAKPVQVTYIRGGTTKQTTILPIQDKLDGRLRLGIWVRDSTAGVGTLSFYDPATQKYGALGHAISDVDTNITLPVREGSILKSTIVGIRKGERGTPGELQGSFLRDKTVLGNIRVNNSFGVFGTTDSPIVNPLYPNGVQVGSQAAVHTGPAKILTTLENQEIRSYDIEISRVSRQATAAQKSLTLHVTDPALLERTGGIVQGMSGSPIIQDGRIIGAVTHVFVNDPTQGYGVFIEWMLQQADGIRAV